MGDRQDDVQRRVDADCDRVARFRSELSFQLIPQTPRERIPHRKSAMIRQNRRSPGGAKRRTAAEDGRFTPKYADEKYVRRG
jgi:hypothetical protein